MKGLITKGFQLGFLVDEGLFFLREVTSMPQIYARPNVVSTKGLCFGY